MKAYSDIDSKFRFVILASKRAKQLLAGAKPKIKSKSKNLIQIAQEEVKKGFVEFELTTSKPEPVHLAKDEIFIGEEVTKEAISLEERVAKEMRAMKKEMPDLMEKEDQPKGKVSKKKVSKPK